VTLACQSSQRRPKHSATALTWGKFNRQVWGVSLRYQHRSAGVARVGPPYFGNPGSEADGRALGLQVSFQLREAAFPGGATRVHKVRIAEFAKAHGLPSMFGSREHCEVGGLASYGANQRATYVRLAAYADRLLRGERPAEIPIEQPTTFELVLNGKTARALGFEIPPSLLARADAVIE
jgi:putative ABC transport system substrate-binding protein